MQHKHRYYFTSHPKERYFHYDPSRKQICSIRRRRKRRNRKLGNRGERIVSRMDEVRVITLCYTCNACRVLAEGKPVVRSGRLSQTEGWSEGKEGGFDVEGWRVAGRHVQNTSQRTYTHKYTRGNGCDSCRCNDL